MDLLLTLDRAAGRLSAQIAGGLRAAIRAGRLSAGTRLPSSRDLARDLAVSRGVVVAAYEQLVAEGFLTSRRGDGTRVAAVAAGTAEPRTPSTASPVAATAAAAAPARQASGSVAVSSRSAGTAGTAVRAGTVPVVPLAHTPASAPVMTHITGAAGTAQTTGGIGGTGGTGGTGGDAAETPVTPSQVGSFTAPGAGPDPATIAYDLRPGVPDLAAFPRERWASAVRAVLRTVPNQALGYPDPAGAPVLRTELAGYLGRVRAAQVTHDRIVVTGGVAHGLSMVARLLAEDGRRVIAVENPSSTPQLPMLEAAGMTVVRVPVDEEGIDVIALERTGARVVLVTPAHQFPTGVVLSPRRRAQLISWARAVDGLVIEDDYDAEFRYDRDPVGCLQGVDPERVVLAGSVSKSLAPALRLGWLAAPAGLAERVARHRELTDLGGPSIEQHALAHLITTGGYDRHLRTMRRRYRTRRDVLVGALREWLPGARVHGVSAGLQLYVELPSGTDERAVVAEAARHGLAVDGAATMWSGPAAAPALVLGYAGLGAARAAAAVRLLGQVVIPGVAG